MPRHAAALLLALLPAPVAAQGPFQVSEAKVEKGQFIWTETVMKPVTVTVEVEEVVNGVKVKKLVPQTRFVTDVRTRSVDLKTVKATDAAGKVIPAGKLADRLKEPTAVVVASRPVLDTERGVFKDTVVFVELPPAPPR